MLPQRTADSGIAVGTGPIELVAMGNYGADVDWLLEDDGAAKLEESQVASEHHVTGSMQVSLGENPEVTGQGPAVAVACLPDELEE